MVKALGSVLNAEWSYGRQWKTVAAFAQCLSARSSARGRNTETLTLTGEACRFYRPVVQLLLLLLLLVIVFIRDLGDMK